MRATFSESLSFQPASFQAGVLEKTRIRWRLTRLATALCRGGQVAGHLSGKQVCGLLCSSQSGVHFYKCRVRWRILVLNRITCIVSSSRSFPGRLVQLPEPNRRRIARGNTNCMVIHLSTIKNSCFLAGPIVLMTWICIGATR
jgi:hypothetical protein